MKKLKFFLLGLMAIFAASTIVSCDDDDDTSSNYDRYLESVTSTIKSNKKHDKVILLVAFGSTWQQAFDAFDETVSAYKQQFTDYDVFLSFSSAICINRAAAGENAADGAEIRNYYAPSYWLSAFANSDIQYSEIVVQSLQVIPGEEYTRVINYIKDFANNSNGDLDETYLSKVKIYLGVPLLADAESDVPAVATALDKVYSSYAKNGIFAFMGHGNPDTYDTYKANVRYTQLEEALQEINSNYYVGTVDMADNFKTDVYERMIADGKTSGTVYCHPLMSIAGDHAHNDMAGDDCQDVSDFSSFELNGDGEAEDTSWKMYFGMKGSGFTCNDNTQIVKGLLELPTIRQIWMNHTKAAINGEPMFDE